MAGMEACAFVGETIPRIVSWPSSPHYWARELARSGNEVRLMPPSYVKPYVKRGKTDAIDAEAICEGLKPLAQRSIDPGDRWKAQDDPARHEGHARGVPSARRRSRPRISRRCFWRTGHGTFWCGS